MIPRSFFHFHPLVVAALVAAPLAVPRVPGAELLTLYAFDEADAGSFTDATGETVIEVVDGVSADPGGGFEGGAAEFNGLGIGLRLPIDINPGVNPNLTIGAWVRQSNFALGVHNAPWGHDDGGWDRGLDTTVDGAAWALSNGEMFPTELVTSEVDWQFVAVTYKGNATSLYVDDSRVFSIPGFAGSSVRTDLAIGSLNPATAIHPFNGWIDNFFIYDDLLTAVQIEAIRTGGVAAIAATFDPPTAPRVVARRWDFESGNLDGWTIVDTFIGDNEVFHSGGQPTNTGSSDAGFDYGSVQGDHFIRTWDGTNGTLGDLSDGHTGIIESDSFVLDENANFDLRVGGGSWPFRGDPDFPEPDMTAVTLERQVGPDDWEAIFAASGVGGRGGANGNVLRDAFWDASLFAGETVRLRIYDTHQGGWGHIDVDDIRYSVTAQIDDPTDSDGDGMGDAWEIFYFGDLSRDGTGDFDGDDLTDLGEWETGTLPGVDDTDGDGLLDGFEVELGIDPLNPDTDGDGWSDPDEIARGTDPADGDDFPMPPPGLWSVDIQAVDGPLFGQGIPVTMSGPEPNAGYVASAWNAFEILGHDLTLIDPSMMLVDAMGAPTPVEFTIFGVVSGFTNATGNVLTTDYVFVNAGNSDPEAEWEIANLTPGGVYDFYAYGGIARDVLLTVDANGNGSLLDEVPELVNATGLLFDDVVAGADGRILGLMQPGSVAEGNWSGFQLLQVSAPPVVDTDGDGLSDNDETNVHGTDRFNPDTDGDGQGDGAEVLAAGTDPTDPTSVLRITSIDGGPGVMVTLTWTSVPGKVYTIEASPDGTGWSAVATVPAADAPAGTTTAVVETPDITEQRRHYRVTVTASP